MTESGRSRREFLLSSSALFGGAWFAMHYPAVLAAAGHARAAVSMGSRAFEVLTPEEAIELEAIAVQIFPTDDTPGAKEAGAIYFIDRALGTFASNLVDPVRQGLRELQAEVAKVSPRRSRFSDLSNGRQIEMLKQIEETSFFASVRTLTVMGMFADPSYGGNRDRTGWNLIGFDGHFAYRPPFGYYDREYTEESPE